IGKWRPAAEVLPPVTKPPVVPLALDEFGKTAAAQPCFTMNWPSSRASLYAAFGTRKPAAKLASIPSIAWMSCRAVCSTKRQRRAAANSSRLTTDGLFGEAKRHAGKRCRGGSPRLGHLVLLPGEGAARLAFPQQRDL